MKTRTRKILIIAALVLIPFWAFGDPPVYFAKSISGQIVDEETGKPLEGVVIVAQWILFEIALGHGAHYGNTVNLIEVVTDQDGKYSIPGWGPRPRPPLKHLDHLDPRLSIFKSQYVPLELSNESLGNHNKAMVRTSEWDGKVIKLKKFTGTAQERLHQLRFAFSGSYAETNKAAPLEILKEASLPFEWPDESQAFFNHVRELSITGNKK